MSGRSAAEVAAYLDELLNAALFRDNEPENGLVVDGGRPVTIVAAAVNTTFDAIDAAAAAGVELLLVHHTSWSYIDRSLHEPKMARLRELRRLALLRSRFARRRRPDRHRLCSGRACSASASTAASPSTKARRRACTGPGGRAASTSSMRARVGADWRRARGDPWQRSSAARVGMVTGRRRVDRLAGGGARPGLRHLPDR